MGLEAPLLQLQSPRLVRENISTRLVALPMEEPTSTAEVRANVSAGHLSVDFGGHPAYVPFLFERPQTRVAPAAAASFALHAFVVVFGLLLLHYGAQRPSTTVTLLPDQPNNQIIWLSQAGPGGGGGGGGNRMKEPPRQAEMPGKDKITVPVAKPPKLEAPQQAKVEPNPVEQLNIPAKSLAAAPDTLPGAIEAPPGPPTLSQGSGSGGGAGTGAGSGIGPGTGSGLGPGSGGGTGGGVYRAGNGVLNPRVLREVRPQYTSDAMRAKVQGTVLLECVVRPDGSVGDVQVVRSLDPHFGLDEEAIKAAKQWRFAPGTRLGEPVPVLITIELTFTLR
jgi:periplasmic protein TonB